MTTKIGKSQKKILAMLQCNKNLSIDDICNKFNIYRSQAESIVNSMREKRLIKIVNSKIIKNQLTSSYKYKTINHFDVFFNQMINSNYFEKIGAFGESLLIQCKLQYRSIVNNCIKSNQSLLKIKDSNLILYNKFVTTINTNLDCDYLFFAENINRWSNNKFKIKVDAIEGKMKLWDIEKDNTFILHKANISNRRKIINKRDYVFLCEIVYLFKKGISDLNTLAHTVAYKNFGDLIHAN
jgi:hypothetical protein